MIDVDEGLRGPHGDLLGAQASLQEAVIALRAYLEDLDAEPGRLAAVEERLEAYARMSRRYGPGTEAVLARADEAREALRGLDEGSADVLALAEEHQALMDEAVELAAALREARAAAAPRLAEAVQDELADLAMPRAELRVELVEDPGDPPARLVRHLAAGQPGAAGGAAGGGGVGRASCRGCCWRCTAWRPRPTTPPGCSTRWTPASGASPPPRSARGCGGWPTGAR